MQQELSIEIERQEGDRYAESMAEVIRRKQRGDKDVFLCYRDKAFFCSWAFTRTLIENHMKTIKIIE